MASGDLALFEPGARVDVVVVADSTGAVPQRGEAVEIVGASGERVHVSTLSDPANFIGHLARTPTAYDETEEYTDGDVVDESSLLLRRYVDWLEAADASALSPGDLVVCDTDGVRAYDNAGGDVANEIVGHVFLTAAKVTDTAGKVAVARRQ